MNATRTIALCAQLETKLDTVLFRRMEDEQPVEGGSLAGTVAKGAAIAGGGYYAGSAITRGLAPLVADRRSGMRATADGFRDASPMMQNVRATGSVLGNNPLKSASAVGGTIASDARAVGSAAKNLAPVKGFLRARAKGVGIGGALKRGLGVGIKAATGGRFGWQSLQSQVIALAAELETVEFDSLANKSDQPGGFKRDAFGVLAAKKGKKWDAFKEVAGDSIAHTAKIAAIGVPTAALIAAHPHFKNKGSLKKRLLTGAAVGGIGSSAIGALSGPRVSDRKYDRHFK